MADGKWRMADSGERCSTPTTADESKVTSNRAPPRRCRGACVSHSSFIYQIVLGDLLADHQR